MSDREDFTPDEYEPKDDPDLQAAIERTLAKWKGDESGVESGTIITDWLVIARARGYRSDGERVDQIMIVPQGSHEDMLGLMANADTRFRAEIIAAILGGGRE